MLRGKRIVRGYDEAGSLNTLLSLWGFVDDQTFLTKAGHVGVVYRVRGVDDEGLTHEQRSALTHRLEAALRLLDEHCRVYQYLFKRTIDPIVAGRCAQPVADAAIQERAAYLNARRHDLFDIRVFLVLLYEPSTGPRRSTHLRNLWRAPARAIRDWLAPAQTLRLLEADMDRAIATLRHKADAVRVQLAEFGVEPLQKVDAFRFFRELVNYDQATVSAATFQYDTHLDFFVADSPVECHRDHLLVGRQRVQVLSMKDRPRKRSRTCSAISTPCQVSSSPAWSGSGSLRTGCAETSRCGVDTSSTSASRS